MVWITIALKAREQIGMGVCFNQVQLLPERSHNQLILNAYKSDAMTKPALSLFIIRR